MLNEEQRRAHNIVEEKLQQELAGMSIWNSDNGDIDKPQLGQETQPLRMLVLGQGGTGKSTLIAAITETFAIHKGEHLLAKCAMTGIAASEIGGQTLHSWAGLPIGRKQDGGDDWIDRGNADNKNKRRKNIEGKRFLIVDEVSMADKSTLYATSKVIVKMKGEEGTGTADESFAGMNVICTGDFHQFPPVRNSKGALYVDAPMTDSSEALIGREIFKQFDTVIVLKRQNRIQDHLWANILDRLRMGECNETDIDEINKLVLTNHECARPDFDSLPWCNAILVTPLHSVREE